ncbi:MAG: tetratricopeptide repeat protein [Planctomycetaceae bacterium]
MTEFFVSAAITVGIALPLAGVMSALVLPRLSPEYKARAHLCWGWQAFRGNRHQAALRQYDRAVEIDAENPRVYAARGGVKFLLNDFAGASTDLNEAIRLAPGNTDILHVRAMARCRSGDFGGAVADFEKVLQLNPDAILPRNNFAWYLSTLPEDTFRDGRRAVTLATEACDLSGWRQADCLGTLSAAYAECGKFVEALRLLERAITLDSNGENAKTRQRMLDAFHRSEPYRDMPSS